MQVTGLNFHRIRGFARPAPFQTLLPGEGWQANSKMSGISDPEKNPGLLLFRMIT
jgi:hypothetical protein